MRTQPIDGIPAQGTLAFGNGLMVRFRADGGFWVFNGRWEGTYDGTHILVEDTGAIEQAEPFEEVVELTDGDRRRWYLGSTPIVSAVRDEDEAMEIPY